MFFQRVFSLISSKRYSKKLCRNPFDLSLKLYSYCIKAYLNIFVHNCKHTMPNLLKPPEQVKNMTVLDKSKFDKDVIIPALQIKNITISKLKPNLNKYVLKLERFKPIQTTEEHGTCVFLNPEVIAKWLDIAETDRQALESLGITQHDFKSVSYKLTFDNYRTDDIFKAVLPSAQEITTSFSKIGHIVHLNLREHLFLYKKLIGEVLFDKVPNTRTVVNKTNIIDNTYRNFKMEVLCGDSDMIAKVRQNKCEFEFDFSTVYWNPRLCTEHERIVEMLKPGDVLFDVFAGVGPFSVPAAKKRCIVFSNDLNPESYKWLNHNSKINKIDLQYLKTYNKDGKDFILSDLKKELAKYINKQNIHITMNLPALAVEFLHSFLKLYDDNEQFQEISNPPIVHVYCFAKGENYIEIAKQTVLASMGCDISDKIVNIFKVRTVSSFKEMIRVSFKLDRDILTGTILNDAINKRKLEEHSDLSISYKKCLLMILIGL